MTTKAEIGMIQGSQPRNADILWKVEIARNVLFPGVFRYGTVLLTY